MKVSITIPTYNRAHLIGKAIQSVLRQTHESWELLVVDDGSTDDTEEAVKEFLSNPKVRYIKKENSGAGHSRNVGVAHSTADIITFLDSDDEAEPFWLEKMTQRLAEDKSDIVCCGLSRYDVNGELIDVKMPKKLSTLFNGITGKFTNGGSFMMKKHIFEAIGGYDPEVRSGQHTELAMRLVPHVEAHGLKISNINESLIRINIHPGARIRTNYKAKYQGSLHTYKKHYSLFQKSKNAKSRYEGIIAFCAYKLGYLSVARTYGLKSFLTRPTLKDFLRYTRYLLSIRKSAG